MRESAYKKIFNVEERQLSPESTQEKKEENIFSSRQHDVLRPWTLSTALPVKKNPREFFLLFSIPCYCCTFFILRTVSARKPFSTCAQGLFLPERDPQRKNLSSSFRDVLWNSKWNASKFLFQCSPV